MVLPCRRLPDHGEKAWREVEERGFEGMVAEDPASHYRGVVEWGFRAHDVLELLREAKSPARHSPFADLRTMRGTV